jgi:O-antigen/teichoic acid export membrane protein
LIKTESNDGNITFVNMSGLIAKNSFWASIVNYSGSLVGLFTTFYLFPLVFTTSENGVFRLFIEMGALLAGVAQLGTGYSIWKFFPRFKNDSGHNGIGFWLLLIPFLGFLLVAAMLLLGEPLVVKYLIENSGDFLPYYNWLIPFVFFFVFNTVFEIFSAALGKIVFSSFLRENVVRILLGLLGWLYYIGTVDFAQTMYSISAVYGVVMVLNLLFILKNTKMSFQPNLAFIHEQTGMKGEFYRYTGYLFLTYVAMLVLQRMDFLMVSSMKGSAETGIYAIAVNMAVLIEIPTRSILQIANPKLSEAIHENNRTEIERLYQKTSLNQFILGALALLLIWVNIDVFYHFMPNGKVYEVGKWAVFYLGVGKLCVLLQGNSAAMLIFSKRYYLSLLINGVSIIVGVLLNQYLIPIMGIEGAALATGGVWLASGVVMALLIYSVYGMQPITRGVAMSVLLFVGVFYINYLWEVGESNLLWMSALKTIVLLGGSMFLILRYRISEDVRSMAKKMLAPIGIRLND